jgi:hypothetical protein
MLANGLGVGAPKKTFQFQEHLTPQALPFSWVYILYQCWAILFKELNKNQSNS